MTTEILSNGGSNEIANPFTGKIASAQRSGSIAETQVATKEVAEVQARVFLAKQFPRNQANAAERILTACQRPGLALSAIYSYPRGGTNVTGPSIRLAEEIVRSWGNIDYGWNELERDSRSATVRAYAWDLETNAYKQIIFAVPLRRTTKKGVTPLTDERDIYEHLANHAARRMRNCVLALIPDDVVDSAVEQCEKTQQSNVQVTPERISDMLKVFNSIGISKAQIEDRFQRKIESIPPAQFVSLQRIYTSIRDGMSKPSDWFEPEDNGKETAPDIIKKLLKKPSEKQSTIVEPKQSVDPEKDNEEPEPMANIDDISVAEGFKMVLKTCNSRARLKSVFTNVQQAQQSGEITEKEATELFQMIDNRDGEIGK